MGTGAWSIISGTGGTVTTSSSPASTFTGTDGTSYTLRWTISNSPCTASTIGTTDDLKNPSLTKMYEFFKTYYVANNMALVIVGDFDSEKIIPIIKEKFGRLASGIVPKFEGFTEEPFKGREYVEVKLTPIKLGILGFRTPPNGASDELAVEVCNRILANAIKRAY